jgi:hypothetical protein
MRLCVSDNNFTVAACVSQWNHRGFYQLWKLSIIISIFNSQFFIHLAIFQFLFILPILHLLTCSLMSLISYFRSYRSSSFVTLFHIQSCAPINSRSATLPLGPSLSSKPWSFGSGSISTDAFAHLFFDLDTFPLRIPTQSPSWPMIADPAPSPTFVRWPYVFNLSTASFDPNHHSLLGHCFLAVVAVVFPTGSFLRTRTLPSSPTHLGIHHMPLVCSSGILFLRCSHLPTQTPSALSSIQISLAFPFISTAFFILLFFRSP